MLQAQKLIRLGEIAGLEGQSEEKPKEEEIAGPGGEALKPPTPGIPFFFSLNQFLCRQKTYRHGIFYSDSYYTWEWVLLADESSDEDEPEEARLLLGNNLK